MDSMYRDYADGSREEIDDEGWRFYRDGKLVISIGNDGTTQWVGKLTTTLLAGPTRG